MTTRRQSMPVVAKSDYGFTTDKIKEFEEAFNVFDKDGNGMITTEELGEVLRSLGERPTYFELKDAMEAMDGDLTMYWCNRTR
ncbi:calmodulin-6 [Lingula anatina]|uniref:Calmodulin-6 n=1 Tax=Lingula anatina TaxID=7574 RepID=A0A1S3IWL5_LINAN|nr:calmodulin-6 [Lingula anatina]|eukprot:XP_013402361.1 calmodulin-6 [Lingula anatina]